MCFWLPLFHSFGKSDASACFLAEPETLPAHLGLGAAASCDTPLPYYLYGAVRFSEATTPQPQALSPKPFGVSKGNSGFELLARQTAAQEQTMGKRTQDSHRAK